MSESLPNNRTHEVDHEYEAYDPLVVPPPRGKTIWVINEGGSGFKGIWYDGAIAWAKLPSLPQSVKDRISPARPERTA